MWSTAGEVIAARRRQLTVALLVFALIPTALLDGSAVPPNPLDAGGSAASRLWLLILPVALVAVLRRPMGRQALRDFAPLGLFLLMAIVSLAWTPSPKEGLGTLLRLLVPALAYLAVRVGVDDARIPTGAGRMASFWIPLIGAALLMNHLVAGFDFPDRLAAMSLAMLFAASTLHHRRRAAALTLGGGALALSVATGSRTASFVVLVMLVLSPGVGLARRTRVAAALVAVAVFAVALSAPAFQDRWFTQGPDQGAGSIVDVLTVGDNLDTSGRRAVWTALWAECRDGAVLGGGLGWSNPAGAAVGEGFTQPHNEYLRVFCDTGIVGAAALLWFFAAVGRRAWRAARVPGAPRAIPAAALLMLAGLAIFAATDNVLTATLQYMAPAAVVFAWSDRQCSEWAPPRLRMRARTRLGMP